MDAKHIAERHVIERYLAGQLSDAEADAFERAVEANPQLVRDIEQVARMKEGFAILERRGELAPLLATPAAPMRHRRTAVLAAAAAAVLALGFLWLRRTDAPAPPLLLAASLEALGESQETPVPLRASIALARARGIGADAELATSGTPGAAALELATGGAANGHYAVDLLAVGSAGARSVGRLPDVAGDAAGVVRVFISLQPLAPGPYLLRLTPGDGGPPVEYSLAVRGAR